MSLSFYISTCFFQSHKKDKKYIVPSTSRHLIRCRNIIECLKVTFEKEGCLGLYRGWLVTVSKAQITNIMAFTTYELMCFALREVAQQSLRTGDILLTVAGSLRRPIESYIAFCQLCAHGLGIGGTCISAIASTSRKVRDSSEAPTFYLQQSSDILYVETYTYANNRHVSTRNKPFK